MVISLFFNVCRYLIIHQSTIRQSQIDNLINVIKISASWWCWKKKSGTLQESHTLSSGNVSVAKNTQHPTFGNNRDVTKLNTYIHASSKYTLANTTGDSKINHLDFCFWAKIYSRYVNVSCGTQRNKCLYVSVMFFKNRIFF